MKRTIRNPKTPRFPASARINERSGFPLVPTTGAQIVPQASRQVQVGLGWWDSLWLSARDINEYAERVDTSVRSLDLDIRPLTEADAVALDNRAAEVEASTLPAKAEYAAVFRNQAAAIRAKIAANPTPKALPPAFVDAWRLFLEDWQKFYAANQNRWFPSSQAWESVENYEKQLGDWRAKFIALGGTPTAPKLPPPDAPDSTWKTFAAVTLVLGAAGGGYYLWRRFTPKSEPPKEHSSSSGTS